MLKTVPVEEAVGKVLPHDITEIVKDSHKGCAFKKGHIIREEDIPRLKKLGKDNIYIMSLTAEEIHENEAATLLAQALSGNGVSYDPDPVEGKISLHAEQEGLLRIRKEGLYQLNMHDEVMCATLHDNTPVQKGEQVAATRMIPMVADRAAIDEALVAARDSGPIIEVLVLRRAKVGLVITGNEIFYKRIEDRFETVLRDKVSAIGSDLLITRFAPDDTDKIAEAIGECVAAGADLVVTSGGMSVDPDDRTRSGILAAGAANVCYGTPVLPGAMFLVGTLEPDIPILGLPACGMYHKITVFDLVLPRILTGQKIGRHELAEMGHGGLCRNCPTCTYPVCNFGK